MINFQKIQEEIDAGYIKAQRHPTFPLTVHYIYILRDPRSNIVRYVGQSIDPIARLRAHIRKSRRPRTHCERWVGTLDRQGIKPSMDIIFAVTDGAWEPWERFFIAKYAAPKDSELTNVTAGGEATWWSTASDEQKAKFRIKMEKVNRSREITPEGKANIASAAIRTHTGRKRSDSTRAKLSATKQGHLNPMYGLRLSESHRAKVGRSLRGRRASLAARENMTKAQAWRRVPIGQYSLDGNLMKIWDSISRASSGTECHHANISACARGKLQKTGGFIWRYHQNAA